MEISILHIYMSNLVPSNSDGSKLFESPAKLPDIFKLKKIFPSNTDYCIALFKDILQI